MTVKRIFVKNIKKWSIFYLHNDTRFLGILVERNSSHKRYLPLDNPEEFERQFESLPKYLQKEILELI
ncbi:hypothetical protein JDFR1000234_43 [uncultured archaeal virus]|jgi:hypothetical protein|uniref:Uncharacterized protein n=1 Tax=uncultured archaeal virus TaxID=1960247 RepID=A0A1S5Y326_9VIRU|nr:hypothetical protein JDFR1000234_43 [uncultured archaeal virus]